MRLLRPEQNSTNAFRLTRAELAQSGQATVEYILLLLITVGIVLMIALKFFQPFSQWANFYLGDYIYCLLDEGELPVLGGQSDTSECDKSFEAYSFANGRPRKNAQNNSRSQDGGSGSGQSNSSSVSGSSGSGRNPFGSTRTGSRGSDGRSAKDPKTSTVAKVEPGSAFFSRPRSSSLQSGGSTQVRIIEITYANEQERRKAKPGEEKSTSIGQVEAEGTGSQKKKFLVKAPERKPAAGSDEIEGFSLGKIFRIGLIIILIVAIILFLGMQALQISKSMEKE